MRKSDTSRKLSLRREVIRQLDELDEKDLQKAAGGVTPVTGLCSYSLYVQCLTQACG